VHWLCHAFWTFSVLSAFLSAAFAGKHTRYLNNVLLEDDRDPWLLKRWFQNGTQYDKAQPLLSIVLLLSGTKMFFDSAVISYIIGLGIYLGFVWQQSLDEDTSQDDSRNIFIVFLISAFFGFCIYTLVDISPRCELREWSDLLNQHENGKVPYICVMRKEENGKGMICDAPTPHEHPDQNHTKEIPEEQPQKLTSPA
jgi:hypothetical protein